MTYAKRLDLLVVSLRRATPFGRRRMIATHRRLIQQRIHLSPVPEGYRVVAGVLVPQTNHPSARIRARRSHDPCRKSACRCRKNALSGATVDPHRLSLCPLNRTCRLHDRASCALGCRSTA